MCICRCVSVCMHDRSVSCESTLQDIPVHDFEQMAHNLGLFAICPKSLNFMPCACFLISGLTVMTYEITLEGRSKQYAAKENLA